MKDAGKYGFLTLALLAAACTLRVPDGYDPPVALRFDPVMYVPSKAGGSTFPEDVPIGVSLWDYPLGGTPSDGGAWLTDAPVRRGSDGWAPVPDRYWPSKDRLLQAVAYAPYGTAAEVSSDHGVVFRDADSRVDLLYTAPEAGLNKRDCDGIVNLAFRHALCQVDFTLRCNAAPGESASVSEVVLSGIYTTGDFRSLPYPAWQPTGAAEDLTFFSGSQSLTRENAASGESRWLIPQVPGGRISVRLRYTGPDGSSSSHLLSAPAPRRPLESGRHYTFALSCLLESMTLKIDMIDSFI